MGIHLQRAEGGSLILQGNANAPVAEEKHYATQDPNGAFTTRRSYNVVALGQFEGGKICGIEEQFIDGAWIPIENTGRDFDIPFGQPIKLLEEDIATGI